MLHRNGWKPETLEGNRNFDRPAIVVDRCRGIPHHVKTRILIPGSHEQIPLNAIGIHDDFVCPLIVAIRVDNGIDKVIVEHFVPVGDVSPDGSRTAVLTIKTDVDIVMIVQHSHKCPLGCRSVFTRCDLIQQLNRTCKIPAWVGEFSCQFDITFNSRCLDFRSRCIRQVNSNKLSEAQNSTDES